MLAIIRNSINYFYYLPKQIKELRKNEKFEEFRLRVDKLNRIYTVVNVPIDVMQHPDNSVQQVWVMGEIREINNFLVEYNLSEIITLNIERIDNEFAYVVIYSFLPIKYSFWDYLIFGIVIFLIFSIFSNFSFIDYCHRLLAMI